MRFDDYNYGMYNKYILVDPGRDDEDPEGEDPIDDGDADPEKKPSPKKASKEEHLGDLGDE